MDDSMELTNILDVSTESGDSNNFIKNYLSSLGCIKLHAIIEQQEQQQNEPTIYKQEFFADLDTIRQTLRRVRQNIILPFILNPIITTDSKYPVMDNLLSVRNLGSNETCIVRAKLVKAMPSRVFPQTKFVHLRCPHCKYYDTYENYVHNTNSAPSIPITLSTKGLSCPKCDSCRNSKLMFTYALLVDIEDESVCTQAIICGNNALNIFKINAFQILTDYQKAIAFDNILYELLNYRTKINLVWLLKKCAKISILRVINVSDNQHTTLNYETSSFYYELISSELE